MSVFKATKADQPYHQEMMVYYKTTYCPTLKSQKLSKDKDTRPICSEQNCFYFHNSQERRREVFHPETHELMYEPVWCNLLKAGICFDDKACKFCHTENELHYHPLYYKTKPCKGCQFGAVSKFCPQYHADESDRTLNLDRLLGKKNKENTVISGSGDLPAARNFILDTFKTKLCTSKGLHNPKVCSFYHSEQDRRRAPQSYSYSPLLCKNVAKEKPCPNGDQCRFSHTKVEQLYHPDRYKKKFCQNHPHNIHKCKYGNYCSFAHSESDIKIKLLHNLKKDEQFYLYMYKTVFCPYICNHDRNQCVYAHNAQDFRRDPSQYDYQPVQCPNWTQTQISNYEEGGCPKEKNCDKCHGWKELEYHPLNYKTKNGTNSKNYMKKDRTFVQSERDNQEKMEKKMRINTTQKDGRMAESEPKLYFDDEFKSQESETNRQIEMYDNGYDYHQAQPKEFGRQNIREKCKESAEKISGFSKGFGKNINEQFKKDLMKALSENGLEHVMPTLMPYATNMTRLIDFDETQFDLFPQISLQDKERIAAIIRGMSEKKSSKIYYPIGLGGNIHLGNNFGMNIEKDQWNRNMMFLSHNYCQNQNFDKRSFS